MNRWLVIAATWGAATVLSGGAAHASAPMSQVDTLDVASGPAPTPAVVITGTPLMRMLAQLDRHSPVTVDVDVVVSPPVSLPAGTYARKYGIPVELAQQIIDVATAEGLDPDLGFRLVRVESVFRRTARGPQGALGLTQLMPSTARAIDRSVRTEAQIIDPSTNLRLGFSYLRRMIRQFGDVRLGLLAYNRGEGTVSRALRAGREPENGYSHKVLGTRGPDLYTGTGLLPARARSGG